MSLARRSSLRPRSPRLLGRWGVVVLLVVMVLAQGGCVRRRLTVRSWPPGAQVFIDDQEIGTTPCSTSFVYYGTRKVTLIKGGYKTETVYHQIPPPWYQLPPLDFVTENLLPNEIRDERVIDLQLTPEENVPQNVLLDRAQGLRDNARAGIATPLPTMPGAAPQPGMPPAATLPDAAPMAAPPQVGVPGDGLPGGEPQFYPATPSFGPPLPAQPPAGTNYLPLQ